MIRKLLCKLGFEKSLIRLIERKNKLVIRHGMNECLFPGYKNTFEYTGTELNIAVLDLKIEVLKVILGENCNKKFEGEDV